MQWVMTYPPGCFLNFGVSTQIWDPQLFILSLKKKTIIKLLLKIFPINFLRLYWHMKIKTRFSFQATVLCLEIEFDVIFCLCSPNDKTLVENSGYKLFKCLLLSAWSLLKRALPKLS